MGPGAPIVQLINLLLERGRASRVVSIGGISVLDLPLDPSPVERRHIDPCSFSETGSNADLLRDAIVLCLGTFDSLADPQPLLAALAGARDNADFMLLSVKDRVRHGGFWMGAPPSKQPVWVAEAFAQALYSAGFSEHCLKGYVSADSAIEAKRSFLVMAGREAAPPKHLPASLNALTVAAVINTYNEIDIVEAVVGYLTGQGIAVHLFDNWSTDGTYEKCEDLLRRGACASLQRFPAAPSEHYEWVAQLDNTAQFAASLDADWVLHYDADEIRCSPWRGMSLREGIAFVDSLGYNAIDFTVLNFAFTDDVSPERFKADQMPFFEFGRDPPYFSQVKAWRSRGRTVDLSSTGGHEALFADRKIFPLKFLTKHYSLRSKAQATRKIFADRLPRFAAERKRLGWHTHYDYYAQARAIEPWHPWELERFDEATFYSDHLLEGIAGIGVERSSLVLPSRRTTVAVLTSLNDALDERAGQLDEARGKVAALETAVAETQQRATHLSRALNQRTDELACARDQIAEAQDRVAALETAVLETGQRATQLERTLHERTEDLISTRDQLVQAQGRVAALKATLLETEKRATQLGRTLHERTDDVARAHERIAAIERELARRVQRIVEIKSSLSWRLMAPFRELYRPVRRLRASRLGVKLRATWRHPRNSSKRKAYRAARMGESAIAAEKQAANPPSLTSSSIHPSLSYAIYHLRDKNIRKYFTSRLLLLVRPVFPNRFAERIRRRRDKNLLQLYNQQHSSTLICPGTKWDPLDSSFHQCLHQGQWPLNAFYAHQERLQRIAERFNRGND
jgi:predicted  nucleic acid-binding Zn-ribbon protein